MLMETKKKCLQKTLYIQNVHMKLITVYDKIIIEVIHVLRRPIKNGINQRCPGGVTCHHGGVLWASGVPELQRTELPTPTNGESRPNGK